MDRENVSRMLAALPQREREVIETRFGLAGDPPRTLQTAADAFDLTHEQIREIENHALRMLAEFEPPESR